MLTVLPARCCHRIRPRVKTRVLSTPRSFSMSRRRTRMPTETAHNRHTHGPAFDRSVASLCCPDAWTKGECAGVLLTKSPVGEDGQNQRQRRVQVAAPNPLASHSIPQRAISARDACSQTVGQPAANWLRTRTNESLKAVEHNGDHRCHLPNLANTASELLRHVTHL